MIYLLDTNAWVQFLRNKNALVVQRIQARQPADLRACSVTAAELCTLVTHNTSEFRRVPGLILEDWELP